MANSESIPLPDYVRPSEEEMKNRAAAFYTEMQKRRSIRLFSDGPIPQGGFQTPFTNITFDLQPPNSLASEPVIIGGQIQRQTYSEFKHEMNLFNQAFLEVMAQGDAKSRPSTFPIPTYNITPDFNWDRPELKPL